MIDRKPKPEIAGIIDKRIAGFFEGYRQNLAVVGKDRSEIIGMLEHCFAARKDHSTVYICLNASYPEAGDFLRSSALAALSGYFHKTDNLDSLLNLAEHIIPRTAQQIKNALGLKQITFMNVLEIINGFLQESGKNCILVIDDFTSLREIFPDCHKDFSQFIILQKKCMVILTSSRIRETEKILGAELNLLFGNFELIYLDNCSLLANYLYFLDLLRPLAPPPDTAAFFINLMHSNSTYYHLLTQAIKQEYSDSWTNATTQVIRQTLYEKDSVLFRKFIDKIELLRARHKDHRTLLKLLMMLSEGYTRKSDLSFFTGLETRKLVLKLQCLLDCEYIEQAGSLYLISDPLFSFWLAAIFKLYLSPHIFNKTTRDRLFAERVDEELSLFRENFSKEKVQRIFDLFSCFKNDTVILDKQRLKCPSLERLKIISCPDRRMNLLVGEGEEILFAGMKEEDTSESDMLDFIGKTNAIKVKSLRKIFISLGDLNPSARFIAKESKINVWNLDEVNSLLRVYNKPVLL